MVIEVEPFLGQQLAHLPRFLAQGLHFPYQFVIALRPLAGGQRKHRLRTRLTDQGQGRFGDDTAARKGQEEAVERSVGTAQT
jgi:hypothetical protein